MVFSIIVVVLVVLVAYFHYLQGFFSAGLSAVMAAVAAFVAFGYYETIVLGVLKGAMGDNALAVALIALFAITYILQRVLFDQFIPGNLRFPLMIDKAGAGVCGLVAGVIAAGVLVVAAQTMPFGPSIGGYERYPIVYDLKVPIQVPGKYQIQDATFNELDHEKFLRDESNKLWVPVDDIMLTMVSMASGENGSLSNGKPFTSVHPNYLQELFGQRVGVQVGSKASAVNAGDKQNVSINKIFYHQGAPLPQQDPERWEVGDKDKMAIGIRHKSRSSPVEPAELKPDRRPEPNKVFLVVRTGFTKEIADTKTVNISFSPSSVRIVAGGQNNFPVGVLAAGRILQVQRPDDYLFVAPDKMVDLVFEIDENAIFASGDAAAGAPRKIANDVFFEFKRLARISLEGQDVTTPIQPPDPESVEVLRKEGAPAQGQTQAASAGPSAPLKVEGTPKVDDKLGTRINVATTSANENNGTQTWGLFSLKERKFSRIELDPNETLQRMSQGAENQLVDAFSVPEGRKMVQVTTRPQGNPWTWADNVPELTLLDSANKRYTPNGVLAKLTNADGNTVLLVRYEAERPAQSMAAPSDARPIEVTLLYLVPAGTELKSFDFRGAAVAPVTLKVP